MRITFFELEAQHEALFDPLLGAHALTFTPAPLTVQNASDFANSEMITTLNESVLSEAVLAQLPHLKLIVSRTTGFDHIPMAACQQRGIAVSYIPHYGIHTVAEHAFALLLSLSHQLAHETARAHCGDFSPKGARGFDLFGKTMGIIGVGNIGRNTVRIARGFNLNVLARDIAPKPELAEQMGFQYVSMARVLAESDFVTLHVPGDESTRNLIGAAEIAQMKPGAILINTARGSVVDGVALADALLSGHLGGACLDVLPHESILRNRDLLLRTLRDNSPEVRELLAIQALLDMPNVVITPHVAYNTREAMERILRTTLENIQGFLTQMPRNMVPALPALISPDICPDKAMR
jgi:D-lactate dehydrogenase